MRRLLLALLLCSAVTCTVCFAATLSGKQADYKTTTTMDMTAMMGAMGMGGKLPKGQALPKPQPIVTTGKVIWAAGKSRTEMKNSYSKTADTTLVDYAAKRVYMLRPATKTALSFNMDDHPVLSSLMRGGGSGPANSEQDYATTLQQLRGVDGVSVKEIGAKKVNGYDCHGIELTIDLAKFKNSFAPAGAGKQDAHTQQMMSSAMAAMGNMTSDVWISDKYKVAVKSLSKTTGMSIVMEMNNIADWKGPDSTFAVPAGYTVKDSSTLFKAPPAGKTKPAHP